jgi:hypothetical protein
LTDESKGRLGVGFLICPTTPLNNAQFGWSFLDLSERFDARLQGAGKTAEDETFPVPMPDESAMRQRFWILEEHRGGGTNLRQAGVLHGQVIPIRVAKQRVTEPGGMGG